MTKVVVVDMPEAAGRNLDIERQQLSEIADFVQYTYAGNEDALASACSAADVILTDYAPFSASVIRHLQNCRLISVAATGYSAVDIDAARKAGISVCAIDEYCTDEVADHTLLLMLALSRRLREYDRQIQHDRRWQFDSLDGLVSLAGQTLGIVGFGRIGRAVATRGSSFGMRIIAHDPLAADARHSLAEVFAEADIVTLHCNLTPDNRALIDASAIRQMTRRPLLINVARGELIDEPALADALDAGRIRGAGLDVLGSESPDLAASPLLGRDNVIVTPHVAFYSERSIRAVRLISAQNIRHFLDERHTDVRQYVVRAT